MNDGLQHLTKEELWKLFPIELSTYQSVWSERYAEESELLKQVIGEESIERINHIGSTAILQLTAKPIVDLLIEIKPSVDIPELIVLMQKNGYRHNANPTAPLPFFNHVFMKGYTNEGYQGQAFHVHVRYKDDWNELYFRDYLLKYPPVAEEYGKLKKMLAEKFQFNRDAYTEAKTDFIVRYTQKAREEFPNRYRVLI